MLNAVLLTQVSIEQPEKQLEDIVSCLTGNLKNPHIEEIHLFVEDQVELFMKTVASPQTPATTQLSKCLENTKVRLIHHGIKPTYSDYFEYANGTFEERIVIVATPDILFDQTLIDFMTVDFSDAFFCLSRDGGQCNPPPEVSQDAWIFRTPISKIEAGWSIGTLGGDNKLAYLASCIGYVLLNPCRSVTLVCHNTSNANRWGGSRLDGPYLNVYPIGFESVRRSP